MYKTTVSKVKTIRSTTTFLTQFNMQLKQQNVVYFIKGETFYSMINIRAATIDYFQYQLAHQSFS